MKTVTIAIPSLRRPDLTARCLEFIAQQDLPPEQSEVVVIENEAAPDSILPDPLPPNTTRIELAMNEGTTGSINRAVAATDSKYVLLLNNDIELQPGYVSTLVRVLDGEPGLGFATGKLLRARQRTHLDGAGDAMLMAGAAYRLGHLEADRGQYDMRTEILSGCGAAVLYRRDAFVKAGGLDEDFFAYLDDLDLALRSQLLGFRGVYLPAAVAYHIGSATLGAALHPKVVRYLTRNQLFLLAKDFPRSVFWQLLPRVLFFQLAWFGFCVASKNLGAYVGGLGEALGKLGKMHRKRAALMSKRSISNDEFISLLRRSEVQIYEWQQRLPQEQRSGLLTQYFRLFKPGLPSRA